MHDKRKHMLYGAGAAILLAVLAGCTTTPKDERSAGRTLDDQNITSSVRTALEREPVYKFEGVEVRTFAGIVQLSGFVNTEDQRQRAQQIASYQSGVTKVVNSLALKPPMMAPTGRPNPTEPRIYSEPNASPGQTPRQSQPK